MYIIFLRFSDNKSQAPKWMDEHNQWLRRGFDDNIFVLAGSIKPEGGGAILAHQITDDALEDLINEDPFVRENVVSPEIVEIAPAKAANELSFLMA